MKKKLRKFSDGGVTEGQNPNIDEDVRSRAMKFVEDASEESRDIGAPVTRAASKSTSSVSKTVAPPAKPAVDMEAEKARIADINKKQGLERVYPEEMIGGGAGKLLQMAGKKLSSKIAADRTAKEAAEAVTKKATRRSEEGFDPSEALAARTPVRTRTIKDKEIPIRQNKPNFNESKSTMSVKDVKNKSGKKVPVKRDNEDMGDGGSGAFKRGGKVSSASRRGDGCAIRGKTRA
jgi:antitoxin component of RelBE/YafQ-DinJ toxin-antitoxin module